jgi:hypothetical protein
LSKTGLAFLRPGFISGYEALARIAVLIAGPGVRWENAGLSGAWFMAETEGQLVIQKEMLQRMKMLPYIKISSVEACGMAGKKEVLASCRVTQKIVPEDGIRLLEGLLSEKGCLLTVKPYTLQLVGVSPVRQNKLGSLLMLNR